jgi:hypothetical protein
MSDENLLTRREFTLEWALAILGAATITITGCTGSGDGDIGAGPSAQPGDKEGAITANHGHSAIIQAALLSSPTTLSLNIRGLATHPHVVDLSQSEVAAIGVNSRVIKISTFDDGHNHEVVFN